MLHVGCDAAAACPDEAQAAFEVMRRAGLRPLLAPVKPGCCGAAPAELGYADEARALATGTLVSCAVPALIALGPACARRFSAAGASGVSGLVTWLWQAVTERKVALSLTAAAPPSLTVWLIETCQLKTGASGEESDLATLLAQLGVDVMNARYPAPHARCCGAAGGMAQIEAQAARRMVVARLAAIPPGVIAVTLEPRCLAHLRAAAPAMTVLGAAGFLARYCTITPLAQATR